MIDIQELLLRANMKKIINCYCADCVGRTTLEMAPIMFKETEKSFTVSKVYARINTRYVTISKCDSGRNIKITLNGHEFYIDDDNGNEEYATYCPELNGRLIKKMSSSNYEKYGSWECDDCKTFDQFYSKEYRYLDHSKFIYNNTSREWDINFYSNNNFNIKSPINILEELYDSGILYKILCIMANTQVTNVSLRTNVKYGLIKMKILRHSMLF